jgi:hypothetical protein
MGAMGAMGGMGAMGAMGAMMGVIGASDFESARNNSTIRGGLRGVTVKFA